MATITLLGNITDPEIPIYGAKVSYEVCDPASCNKTILHRQVLGIRQGHLDLHGHPRNVTWTRLAETAMANASSITLQQEVDWVPGDRIVIAPTGKNGNETEVSDESCASSGTPVTGSTTGT